jgi:osmotically inducible protein OsmC
MAVTNAEAKWAGNLREGNGSMTIAGHALPFTFVSRFEPEKETDQAKTNPEELIGAAIAGCFSMFLSALLSGDKYVVESVQTTASVTISEGPTISDIALTCRARIPGIDTETFAGYAEKAKIGCPVSKALAGVETISLDATLAD